MVVRCGVDDGTDADVQGPHTIDINLCACIDDILYYIDIPERDVDTGRGLWMFWRCTETYALADILQEFGASADGVCDLVSLS